MLCLAPKKKYKVDAEELFLVQQLCLIVVDSLKITQDLSLLPQSLSTFCSHSSQTKSSYLHNTDLKGLFLDKHEPKKFPTQKE